MLETNEKNLLRAEKISKTFDNGVSRIEVLKSVTMAVHPGEMTAIVGASGSGKTTLLQILGTLDTPTSGRLIFENRDLTQVGEAELPRHRNEKVGFIFQFHHLLAEFTALENVMMPGLIAGSPKKILEEESRALLSQVGLSQRCSHRSGELSGGEQQRVALARALIMKPAILLADEPTGNLDSQSGQLVFEMLQSMSSNMSLAVVMVTHNMELAHTMDSCLTLEDGILLA